MIQGIISRFSAKRAAPVLLAAAMCVITLTGCGSDSAADSGTESGAVTSDGAGSNAAASAASSGEEVTEEADSVTKYSYYFDTIVSITVYSMYYNTYAEYAGDEAESTFAEAADAVISDAFSLCAYYENTLSRTVEGSDVWNVNHAGGEPVVCDTETINVVKLGIRYGDLSGGRFDITIGPVSDLWNFNGTDASEEALPDEAELAEALSHVDYQTVVVDEEASTVQLLDAEAMIDLGGIAKGYIADRVCELLREEGVTGAIVSLGGNIACVGGKPEEYYGFTAGDASYKNFTIGIESPYSDMTSIVGSSQVYDGTMVTSGIYERYITVDDVQYHHILDVETGYPVESDVVGVTLLGPSGTSVDCDALATICLILGSEEGYALIGEQDGLEAAFILTDNSILLTDGMDFTASE